MALLIYKTNEVELMLRVVPQVQTLYNTSERKQRHVCIVYHNLQHINHLQYFRTKDSIADSDTIFKLTIHVLQNKSNKTCFTFKKNHNVILRGINKYCIILHLLMYI